MKNLFFKNLEKQTYLLFFRDGIIELLFGSIFIVYAINTWFDSEQFFRPYWLRVLIIPVAIVLALVKELVTKKRIGTVSFSKKRKQKTKWMYRMLIISQLIILVAIILAKKGMLWPNQKTELLPLLIEFIFLILIFYALTWFTSYSTFFVAGLVFTFSTPFLLLLNPEFHHSYIRIGIMLTAGFSFGIFGAIRLIQFLKTFPNPDDDDEK